MHKLKTINVKAERIEKFNIKDFAKRYAPDIVEKQNNPDGSKM